MLTMLVAQADATLATTHLEESSAIATGLVQWGGDYVPIYSQIRDPKNRTRYRCAREAPLSAKCRAGILQERY